jgi:CubicO group peptidase (beta-lactamase class C family)
MNLNPFRVVALAAVACFASLTAGAQTEGRWPTEGWEWVTPEAAGFDSAKLAEAVRRIHAEVPYTHSVFLELDGQAFLDAAFYPYDGGEMHNLASVTKSVMTTLIAIAADQGRLALDQPMLDFVPDRTIANLDERKRRITVRHLTGMVSGLACVGEHDEPTLHEMNASPDWVQFTLDLPMAAEPGTTFSYCSPGMHLLSATLQKATGQTAFDFAKANLFGPLGITEAAWPADAQGVSHGWGDLRLFPRDAAKIGYLWINGGRWEGRQIVSEEWVEASSTFQIKTGDHWGDDYGYGWWILSDGGAPGYAAVGRGGQRIGVFPTLNIVAVTTGGGIEPGEVLDRLATAMVSPGVALPESPEGRRALDAALAAVREPPAPVAPAALPPLATEVSGRTYRFEPNPLGLASLRLDFDRPEAAGFAMTFSDGLPPRSGEVGLDGVLRMFPGEDGVTAGMRGGWAPEGKFRAEYDGIAMIDAFDLLLDFDGDRLLMTAKDVTYEEGVTLQGRAD